MKKIMLGALALMFGTIGFAQTNNDAQVNQTGNENDALVKQVGDNTATVDQYGTNYARVDQNGFGNVANVDQGSASHPVTNMPNLYYDMGAWIKQIGNRNDASIKSVFVANTSYNSGSQNGSSILQDGDDNKAEQVLNSYISYRDRTLRPRRKAIDIVQKGNWNEAYQRTRANFGSHGIQQMWIDQIGNNNYANQYSNGGAGSVMTVKQVGNNNGNATSADVSSTGMSSPLNLRWGTKMPLANRGGINRGKIRRGDYTQYQNGRFSEATIAVTGDDNKTTQAQEFTVWSDSGDNTAGITIVGNRNAVIQGQMGERNESSVDIVGDDNVATTGQEGDLNLASIFVRGNLNTGAIEQTGNGHEGIIKQYGDSNFGTIKSVGNDHFGSIIQTGNMNNAVITQQN